MVEVLTPAECIGIYVLRLDTLLELLNFHEDPAQLLFEVAHIVNDFTFLHRPQKVAPRPFAFFCTFEELCEKCFYECESLSHVTFGESSSLKLIGKMAFFGSGLTCFCLPGSVSSIGGSSFPDCSLKDLIEVACSRFIFRTVFKNFVSPPFPSARIFRVLHLVSLLH